MFPFSIWWRHHEPLRLLFGAVWRTSLSGKAWVYLCWRRHLPVAQCDHPFAPQAWRNINWTHHGNLTIYGEYDKVCLSNCAHSSGNAVFCYSLIESISHILVHIIQGWATDTGVTVFQEYFTGAGTTIRLTIGHGWFNYWFGAKQATTSTWTDVDQDLRCHKPSLDHNMLHKTMPDTRFLWRDECGRQHE